MYMSGLEDEDPMDELFYIGACRRIDAVDACRRLGWHVDAKDITDAMMKDWADLVGDYLDGVAEEEDYMANEVGPSILNMLIVQHKATRIEDAWVR